MINLTRGVPPVEVFPIDDLVKAADKNMHEDGKCVLQYLQSPGYAPLRDWLAQKHGVESNQVLLGNSSLELMQFVTMTEVKPGDRIFLESPSYDRANTLMNRCGAQTVGIPMENDGIDLNAFEKELKRGAPKLVYIIADFQNPMGTMTSLAKRQQLAKWAQEYNFLIAEDSPYRDLRYRGEPIPTLRSMAPDHVLQMSSFSKILAPGLRMGYVVGTPAVVKRMTNWAVNTYIGPVIPTQGMVYEYCKAGLLEPNIQKLCKLYGPRLDALLKALDAYWPGASYPRPDGGFFVGVTLPKGNSMETLIPRALEAGFKLTDGRGFFLNPQDGDRFLRIPFCSLTPAEIEDAVSKLTPLLVL